MSNNELNIPLDERTKVLFSPAVETFCGFATNVDSSRLNMENKQLGQLVISKNTTTPFIISKFYKELSTVNSPFQTVAEDDGFVLIRDNELLVVYYKNLKKIKTFHIPKFKKLINNSLSLKFCVNEGELFEKNNTIFDYSNYIPETQVPRIGYRTNILFSSFFGFNSDDAFVVSESFAKKTTIEYSHKIFVPITKFMKFTKRKESNSFFPKIGEKTTDENISKYYNIDMDEFFLTEVINIDETMDSKYYIRNVKGLKDGTVENIKIHKITDKSFDALREEYFYTKELITELEYYYKNTEASIDLISKKLEAVGIPEQSVQEFTKSFHEQYYEMKDIPKPLNEEFSFQYGTKSEDIDFMVELDFSIEMPSTKGDKFSNLYAGKGTISLIIPDELMPRDPNTGKPFDLIFNTLGIPGRNNWGSIFELNLSKIIRDIENSDTKARFDKLVFIFENLIKKIDLHYYNTISPLLSSGIKGMENIFKDIDENGLYLFFENYNDITYHEFMKIITQYEEVFNVDLTQKKKIHFSDALMTYMRQNISLENPIFKKDDISGFYNSDPVLGFGENYLIKLYHTSDSKYNSVSFTSYSKSTGQPLRGKKAHGGQKLSWQSTASLLSHHENNAVLKELYTFKSDSQQDKETFIMKIIKDGSYHLKDRYESITKKTISPALKTIGMAFKETD